MKNNHILFLLVSLCLLTQTACLSLRLDEYHVFLRSDIIKTPADEQKILSKAKLSYSKDGKIPILTVRGTAYERGYQQGALLRKDVQDNLKYMYKNMLKTFHSAELFSETFERMRPYISEEYLDEMHGLAHGAKLPLSMIQHFHALPELSEWGGKKKLKEVAKQMIFGKDLGTSCSNFSLLNSKAKDDFYTVRILDWGLHRISKLHQYPLITINVPDQGITSVNIGWVGFLGAVSGMNAQGITLGEMGYGDPENETLRGQPMIFLLRDVLSKASNLSAVRKIIGQSKGTNSYIYLMSDGKSKTAEMYVKDATRFLAFKPGQTLKDNEEFLPGIKDTVYGGHYNEILHDELLACTPDSNHEYLMKNLIPKVVMKSNFQNVVYQPGKLQFWVNYAKDAETRASEGEYTLIKLEDFLGK